MHVEKNVKCKKCKNVKEYVKKVNIYIKSNI